MKKSIVFLLCLGFMIMACQEKKPAMTDADRDAASKAVSDLFENYAKLTTAKDVDGVSALLADDGLFLGTDPGEFWNKQQIMEQFKTMVQDTAFSFDITNDRREVRLAPSGVRAVVVEHSIIPFLSQKIMVRGVGNARLVGKQWKIDFYSWSLIPKNEDLSKLNKALE